MGTTPRIIVVGGGFAGLWAARGLRSANADVLLIDRTNHHTFQPLLYQVATAGLAAPAIAAPLRHILREHENVTVLLGNVSTIDVGARRVIVGRVAHEYDFLVIAAGVMHTYFGHDDWLLHAPGLKTLDDALRIRRRILTAFERAEAAANDLERAAWLNFVIVGAGPTGVELAGTLAEIARHTLKREFRRFDPAKARVLLVEAGPRVLPTFPRSVSVAAQRQLERLGVSVYLDQPLAAVNENSVEFGGQRVAARTVIWAAGVAASPIATLLDAELDRTGRVIVAPDLSVPKHPEVFVAGDLAHVEGPAGLVPGVAPAAKQMGHYVANALRARLAGQQIAPFHYRHFGSLATIGRRAAVIDFGPVRMSGWLAWWIWLFAHIYFLIGFRNRVVVLVDWAVAYWTHRRSARIIVGAASRDANQNGTRR